MNHHFVVTYLGIDVQLHIFSPSARQESQFVSPTLGDRTFGARWTILAVSSTVIKLLKLFQCVRFAVRNFIGYYTLVNK
jgi:hypothetical protein